MTNQKTDPVEHILLGNSLVHFYEFLIYCIRPRNNIAKPWPKSDVKVVRGTIFDEVAVSYEGGWLSQSVRVFHEDTKIENSWRVGPIPVDDIIGKVKSKIQVITEIKFMLGGHFKNMHRY